MKLSELPTHTRVWIYQSDRFFTDEEVQQITTEGEQFIHEWAAHGDKLAAGLEVFHNLFIVLAVDEVQVAASGCSIDSSVRFIKTIGEDLNVDLFNRMSVSFIDRSDKLRVVSMEEFRNLWSKGEVDGSTTVYNNLVSTLGDFIGKWKTTAAESWHATAV